MKTVCPACGAISSLEALLTDADARLFMAALTRLPSALVFLAPKYLALFRPQTGRVLQWRKGTRVLTDLQAMVLTGHVHRQGLVDRPCPVSVWAAAVERIIGTPPARLPLKNHQYLAAIAWDLADGLDRRQEKVRDKKSGEASAARPAGQLTRPMAVEQMREIRRRNMKKGQRRYCLLYTSPSPRDRQKSRMPSSA
eukprot:TRINITY_DN9357_c0_g1_i1.p3 TRINITY_DN9357_c0_g1~~TRINITY_DN9357_c0_g1_i1.p3  ORF type:complete len:196 (-),score=62.83 TRINITY_DN9357_c0_g1_i1:36-623(-)